MTEPTDTEILDEADDFRSQYMHGGITFDEFDSIGFARAVLAKWGTPAPVGVEPALHQYQASDGTWKDFDSERHRRDTVAAGYPVRTLYTVTQTGAGAAPMTPEQRDALWESCKYDDGEEWTVDWEQIVDAVERHHRIGIKGGQQVD